LFNQPGVAYSVVAALTKKIKVLKHLTQLEMEQDDVIEVYQEQTGGNV
jgi:hypothetical protein